MYEMQVWYWNPKLNHDPDLEQDFDFDKNFEKRHQIWWVSLVYKE